jgi:hypothetical protein
MMSWLTASCMYMYVQLKYDNLLGSLPCAGSSCCLAGQGCVQLGLTSVFAMRLLRNVQHL